jgi:hypothetical protein
MSASGTGDLTYGKTDIQILLNVTFYHVFHVLKLEDTWGVSENQS